MTSADLIPFFVAIAVFAAVWLPARRGNLWARVVAWGAIVFVFTIMIRAMKGN